jgi:hypothetical protein
MTNPERKELLVTFLDAVKDELLSRADRIPETWDGCEIIIGTQDGDIIHAYAEDLWRSK